jgi:hypothetical protein
VARNAYGLTLLALLALAACTASDADEPAAPAAAVPEGAAPARPAAHTDSVAGTAAAVAARTDSLRDVLADSIAAGAEAADAGPSVLRETFAYAGAARDPFISLIDGERIGPEFVDLQLVAVYQDLQYPSNSVAVIRDRVSDRRYKVRAGDELGTMRVREVRAKDVVITVQDFGYSRQEILSLRQQEDVTP